MLHCRRPVRTPEDQVRRQTPCWLHYWPVLPRRLEHRHRQKKEQQEQDLEQILEMAWVSELCFQT